MASDLSGFEEAVRTMRAHAQERAADYVARWQRGERSVWSCTYAGLALYPARVAEACDAFASIIGHAPNRQRMAFRIGCDPDDSPMTAACREAGYVMALALCPNRRAWRPAGFAVGMDGVQ